MSDWSAIRLMALLLPSRNIFSLLFCLFFIHSFPSPYYSCNKKIKNALKVHMQSSTVQQYGLCVQRLNELFINFSLPRHSKSFRLFFSTCKRRKDKQKKQPPSLHTFGIVYWFLVAPSSCLLTVFIINFSYCTMHVCALK